MHRFLHGVHGSGEGDVVRTLRIGLTWLVLVVATGPARAADPADARLVHPTDPEWALVQELVARGELPPSAAWGDLTRGGLRDLAPEGPAGLELTRWLRSRTPTPATRVLTVRPRLHWGLRGGDPDHRFAPPFASPRGEPDPASRLQTTLDTDIGFTASLHGHLSFRFDSEGANDPLNRTRDFHQLGVSNNVDRAYVRWRGESLSVLLGRAPVAWGPEPAGPVLLSPIAPALDQIRAELRWGPHVWRMLVGQLSSVAPDSGAVQHRTLYGHRLDLDLGRLTLGISEVTVVSQSGPGLSLRYLNPVGFHAQAQVEQDGDSGTQVNVFHSVDGRFDADPLRFHGSFLVDDLQIDQEGRDRYPHQLAWTLGVQARGPGGSRVGYGYRRIGSWTYLHRGIGTDHQHFGRPLGAPEGPDTDRHRVWMQVRPGPGWSVELTGERWRRGSNRLGIGEDRAGHSGDPFPRGVVERRWVGRAAVTWSRPPHLRLRAEAAWASLTNTDNVPGDSGDVVEVRLGVTWSGPALAWSVD